MAFDRIALSIVFTCAALLGCEEGPPPDLGALTDADGLAAPAPSTDGGQPEPEPEPEPELVVTVDTAPLTLAVAEVTALAARVTDSAGQPVEAAVVWRSADPLVAWIGPEGAALGVGAGDTTVYAEVGAARSMALPIRVEAARPEGASYSAGIDPILRGGCATSGCHVDGIEPGDLRFDRRAGRMWEELVDDSSEQTGIPRVMPGDPAGSYLLQKLLLDRPPVGGRMPLGRPPLPVGDMQAIVAWIAAGAPR